MGLSDSVSTIIGVLTIGAMILGSHRSLSRRLDRHDLRFDRLEERIEAVRVEAAGRSDGLGERSTQLEASLGQRIDAARAETGALGDRLEARILSVDASLGDRISSVDASLGERISSVEASLEARISAAESNLGTRISAAEANVGERVASTEAALSLRINRLDDRFYAFVSRGGPTGSDVETSAAEA